MVAASAPLSRWRQCVAGSTWLKVVFAQISPSRTSTGKDGVVSTLKMNLYRDLQKTDPDQPGFVSFPSDLDDEYIFKSSCLSAARRLSAMALRFMDGPKTIDKTMKRSTR